MDASRIRGPELLLPAGSFESAIAAIEGGADALYFGFADFSARKQARNLDRLQYRRLLAFAGDRGVKLYAALNTLILERELPLVAEILAFMGRFPPDAVIIQDWGLAALIRARLSGVAIHASTQCAIQGSKASRIAAELGVSRIVLPRETSISRLARLCAENPSIEYEVFAHGALCYSYSGLCLASGLLLGRSGNRGECAQICRSYYDAEGGNIDGRRGYWFSCRDLCLVDRLGELARAGAKSLKIEGRMKSPEYCYYVARLYRGALDRLHDSSIDDADMAKRLEDARLSFARAPTEGWAGIPTTADGRGDDGARGGTSLLDPEFPGHRGIEAGSIEGFRDGRTRLRLKTGLGLRDGLMIFDGKGQALPFSLSEIRDPGNGRAIGRARADTTVEIATPKGAKIGDRVWKLSARELDLKNPSPEEYPPRREVLKLELRFLPAKAPESLRLGAELQLPGFGAPGASPDSIDAVALDPGDEFRAEISRSPGGFAKALGLFREAGDNDFILDPRIEAVDLFMPPSLLKREKNRMYASAARLLAEAQTAYARRTAELPAVFLGQAHGASTIPPRSALVFPHELLPSGMPFATPRLLRAVAEGSVRLPDWGGASWLPLAPLVAESEDYERLARDAVGATLDEGGRLFVGLGGLHHVALARELSQRYAAAGENLGFFLDIHSYIANRLALAEYSALFPRISFAYYYIESDDAGLSELQASLSASKEAPALAPVDDAFEAPLFLSAGCLLKHHAAGGNCPAGCPRSWSARLLDRDRTYSAMVEDCVSMLFRAARGVKKEKSPGRRSAS